jgi:hypothetical protein
MMVPMEWEGSHRITFVATFAFYDFLKDFQFSADTQDVDQEALKAAAVDTEAAENIVFYHVKPGDIPMDVLTVRASRTDPVAMEDAPVSVVGKANGSSGGGSDGGGNPNGGNPNGGDPNGGDPNGGDPNGGSPNGSGTYGSSSSGNTRSILPNTADKGDGVLAGGLAAAGAAVLAYERRRAKNEGK